MVHLFEWVKQTTTRVLTSFFTSFPDRCPPRKPSHVYHLSPEALELWSEWYLGDEYPTGVHSKRLDTLGWRLLVLLAFNEGKAEIDVDVTTKVIKIMEWEYKVRCFYSPIKAANRSAQMEESIRRRLLAAPNDTLPMGRLKSEVGLYHHGYSVFESAMKRLTNARAIEIVNGRNSQGKMTDYVRYRGEL
jgi:hypothetical protein